jgi:hypothetical protein
VPEFFNPQNAGLQRLAEHRAWYNGYNVAIVNVADILDDNVGFEYEGAEPPNPPDAFKREQRLRTFIRRVFEGANAPNMEDGHLAFVLLVGDNYNENAAGMPTSFDHNETIDEIWPNEPNYDFFLDIFPIILFDKSDTLNHTPIAGELLRLAKTLPDQSFNINIWAKYAYNLFGDPAL